MNTIVWILQCLLAVMFTFSGLLILLQPKEKIASKMPFVNDYSSSMVKLVAFSHITGALGITLPLALGILPILTPIAASCLVVVMILALKYNIGRRDTRSIVTDVVIGILFCFIAYYRFKN